MPLMPSASTTFMVLFTTGTWISIDYFYQLLYYEIWSSNSMIELNWTDVWTCSDSLHSRILVWNQAMNGPQKIQDVSNSVVVLLILLDCCSQLFVVASVGTQTSASLADDWLSSLWQQSSFPFAKGNLEEKVSWLAYFFYLVSLLTWLLFQSFCNN